MPYTPPLTHHPALFLSLSRFDDQVLSIETGQVLREFKQLVQKNKKIDVIEQFNQKLLLKQEHSPLSIVDLLNSSVIKVPPPPPAYFLFEFKGGGGYSVGCLPKVSTLYKHVS